LPSREKENAIGASGGKGTVIPGEGGVEGDGGLLCATAGTLIKSTIAKTVSRLLILMRQKSSR
jgi:hypothetical protein